IIFEKKQGIKYRTVDSELSIIYDRDLKNDKYFISNGSLKQTVEVFNRKSEKALYKVEYVLIVTEPFSNDQNFISNVKNNKELFKLDLDFDNNFWLNQNQLPLTKELNNFIKNIKVYEKE